MAGKNAEKQNAIKVTIKHLENTFSERKPKIEYELRNLSDTELKIIKILSEKEFLKSSELYIELNKQGIAERTARKYIEKLEKDGIIKTKLIEGKGKWRHIWLRKDEKE